MFIVSLKFTTNRSQAGQHMQAHKDWLDRSFADGVFLVSGSIQPNLGGVIVAHGTTLPSCKRWLRMTRSSRPARQCRVWRDYPSRADERLAFLVG